MDGCVYGWNLHTQTRVEEHYNKSAEYSDLAVDHKPSGQPMTLVACGSDGKLHQLYNATQEKETVAINTETTITSIVISHNNKYVFAGTSTGFIRIYPWPLPLDSRKFRQYRVHSGPIVRLSLTLDDFYLFSVAKDGMCYCCYCCCYCYCYCYCCYYYVILCIMIIMCYYVL